MGLAVRVGVVGVTGYLGQELLRILVQHPNVEVVAFAASAASAGKRVPEALPAYRGVFPTTATLAPPDAPTFSSADVVFLAAGHGVAKAIAPALLAQGNRVIDLSGDHRIADAAAASAHYGGHGAAQAEAVYGLPETNRVAIRRARLVANPGCYPTASALAALPLVEARLVAPRIVVDAKSGVSGAGKEPTPDLHFPETNESARAYKVGEHRHEPEIAQALSTAAGSRVDVTFTPHIVPMNRGILATAYLFPPAGADAIPAAEVEALYAKRYSDEPFVRVVPTEPDTKLVRGTNWCDVRPHAVRGAYVVTAAIDNLVKGGSGQAVQNMNLMLGLPEKTGLPVAAVVP